MQTVVKRPAILSSAGAAVQPRAGAKSAMPARSASIAAVWRASFATFGAHAPAILFLALIGFAGASVIGLGMSLALNLEQFVHASGPFATYEGIISILALGDARLFTVLVTQGVLGWVLVSFARGAITQLALNDGSLGQACRGACARMPALLAGSLLYSALIGFGAVSINAWLRDRNPNLDLSNVGQRAGTFEGALKVLFIRGVDALIPDPGSPVAEFVPRLRHTAFRHVERGADYNQQLAVENNTAFKGATSSRAAEKLAPSEESQRVVIASMLALVLGETLLHFRAVAAVQSPGVFGSLLRCVWWGIRYFIPTTIHIWLVRLALLGANILFVTAPIVIVQCLVLPTFKQLNEAMDTSMSLPWMLVGITLVNTVFTAFSTVYDARLYVALTNKIEHAC